MRVTVTGGRRIAARHFFFPVNSRRRSHRALDVFRNLAIEKTEERIASVDQMHLDAERGKVPAYSAPTTPAPTTARVLRQHPISRISSESCTRGCSKGNSAGRIGDEPVAIRIFSPAAMYQARRERCGDRQKWPHHETSRR